MHDNISELERLAWQPGLVCPLYYDNPDRVKQQFYIMVQTYATLEGMRVREKEISFIQDVTNAITNIPALYNSEGMPVFSKAVAIAESAAHIALSPLYPILGGGWGIRTAGDEIEIAVPRWDGIKRYVADYRMHEYFHAYHIVLARDLRRRRLISIDGFLDVGTELLISYRDIAPTLEELKRFESMVLGIITQKQRTVQGRA